MPGTAQAALTKVMTLPASDALSKVGSQALPLFITNFLSLRSCQYLATCCVPGLSMETCQDSPFVPNQDLPVCQVNAAMS